MEIRLSMTIGMRNDKCRSILEELSKTFII